MAIFVQGKGWIYWGGSRILRSDRVIYGYVVSFQMIWEYIDILANGINALVYFSR